MQLNTRVYDVLKFVALVLLPGFSTAYFSLSQLWDLPNAQKVVGTAVIIDTLLGLLLKASTNQYNKTGGGTDGDLIVNDQDGERYLSLGLAQQNLAAIPTKDTVTLKVVTAPEPPK